MGSRTGLGAFDRATIFGPPSSVTRSQRLARQRRLVDTPGWAWVDVLTQRFPVLGDLKAHERYKGLENACQYISSSGATTAAVSLQKRATNHANCIVEEALQAAQAELQASKEALDAAAEKRFQATEMTATTEQGLGQAEAGKTELERCRETLQPELAVAQATLNIMRAELMSGETADKETRQGAQAEPQVSKEALLAAAKRRAQATAATPSSEQTQVWRRTRWIWRRALRRFGRTRRSWQHRCTRRSWRSPRQRATRLGKRRKRRRGRRTLRPRN